MTKWLFRIDETGLHLPDYPTVLKRVQDVFREIYGPDLYLEPDSQDGQLVAVLSEAFFDAFQAVGDAWNSYSPTTAHGASLSRQVAINGLQRKQASRSSVTLRCVGVPGTRLKGARARDRAGNTWILADAVLPPEGEVFVSATAEDEGQVRAQAGEITIIATPTRGWHSVTNPLAASPGAPVETDAALRRRQKKSTALPSRTVFDGTEGAVAAVEGVTRSRCYENDGCEPNAFGLPQHSITAVVEGGDERAIAQAIALHKTPGCGTWGDIWVDTRDRRGAPLRIFFWRVERVPVRVRLRVRPLSGYLSSTGEAARAAVCAAINALEIGEDVLVSRLYSPVNGADRGAGTFDLVSVELARGTEPFRPGNIAIAFREAACADPDAVSLEIVS